MNSFILTIVRVTIQDHLSCSASSLHASLRPRVNHHLLTKGTAKAGRAFNNSLLSLGSNGPRETARCGTIILQTLISTEQIRATAL
mmetsp:Transcript_6661/g.13530  ORF Transcript_6661/g.13530 Transcript_6661/m.13530 type:complete len:86 (+) Transcript_6661:826-1083(+)